MHSDYCREMEGDAHAGYLSKFGPRSKESKHLDIVAWNKTVASCMIIEAVCFGLYVLVVTEGPRLPGVDSTRTILRISWLGPKCLGLIVESTSTGTSCVVHDDLCPCVVHRHSS